jgi:hypothetical protein
LTSNKEIEEQQRALNIRLAPVVQALRAAGTIAQVKAALTTARSRDEGLAYLESLHLSDDELTAVAGELGCYAWYETDPPAIRERMVRNLATWQG